MDSFVNLEGLEQMDRAEVAWISEMVCGMLGEFDPRVHIEGVYFGERRYPHTVYQSASNRFTVAICLPQHQSDEPLARLAHLSHELVHCLNPNGYPPQATTLEEGLAEHAKIYLCRDQYQGQYPNFDFRDMSDGKYSEAFNRIEDLIGYEGLDGMRLGVQSIRIRTRLPFCLITAGNLAEQFKKTPELLLDELSRPFRD